MRIFLLLLLAFPVMVSAVTFTEQADPFAITQWTNITKTETYYSTLGGFPHTYEFIVTASTTFNATLSYKRSDDPVSLILVREQARGVAEVTRIDGQTAEGDRDRVLGVRLRTLPPVATELTPGIYRLEVSNPDNNGRYQLQVGTTEVSRSYWQTIKDTFAVHGFYGWSITALFTWRILLPIGVVIVLYCLYQEWRKQSEATESSTTIHA